MLQSNSIILQEITGVLKNYFTPEETEKIQSMLSASNRVGTEPYNMDAENEKQLTSDAGSGSSLRNQIDKLLSFVDQKLNTEKYIELSLNLIQLLLYSGETDVAENVIEHIKKSDLEEFPKFKAESLLLHSKIAWNRGEWKFSSDQCKKGYLIYSDLEDIVGMSKCENMLATIAGEKGEVKSAKEHLKKALEFIKYYEEPELKAMINNNLGIISDLEGHTGDAKFFYNNAIVNYNKTNNKYQEARINHNVGMLLLKQQNFDNAIQYFDESIRISLEKGYLSNCAISFISKANAYAKLGQQDLAELFSEKALEFAFKINDRLSIADVYRVKGLIYKNLDNIELSEEFFENSLRLNEDFQNKVNIKEANEELANLQQSL